MNYCIDSCSFIEVGDSYRPSVFPSIIKSIDKLIDESRVFSAYEVYEELKKQEDDIIFKWLNTKVEIFILPHIEIQRKVKYILKEYPRLIDYRTGKSGADPWIIATAIIRNLTVVTEEQFSGDLKYPKIPDVCRQEGIECIKLIDFLETEKLIYI